MSKSAKIIAIILCFIGAVFIFFWIFSKQTSTKPKQSTKINQPTLSPTPETEIPSQLNGSPTQTSSSTPKTTEKSLFSAELKAKARNSFIANCKTKFGQEYTKECTCGADYLASHYTDSELEKVYVEYHSSNAIPKAVQAAYDACKE
jgi:hypothetical protein